MLTDAVRLLVFPALMAFAASSDLLTMTISNRVSLILMGGFFALAFFGSPLGFFKVGEDFAAKGAFLSMSLPKLGLPDLGLAAGVRTP